MAAELKAMRRDLAHLQRDVAVLRARAQELEPRQRAAKGRALYQGGR